MKNHHQKNLLLRQGSISKQKDGHSNIMTKDRKYNCVQIVQLTEGREEYNEHLFIAFNFVACVRICWMDYWHDF